MFKIGLIGSGFIGSAHAMAYQNIEHAKLVAIADINEVAGKKMAADFRCKYYQHAEQMLLEEDIDIVDICLPTFLHEQYVELAAQHHKHVLCEKPFGLSVESCRRMQTLCEDTGVKLMVAQAARWVPEFSKIKEMIDSGTLGKLHMVNGKRLSQPPAWTKWHTDPLKSGGGLYDLHVHNIDFLYSLFGNVKSVYATGWKSDTGCWNHIMTNIEFQSGVVAVDEASLEMVGDYPFSVSMRLVGDKATAEYSSLAGKNIEKIDTATQSFVLYEADKSPCAISVAEVDPYEAELRDYLKAISNNQPVPIQVSESVYVMSVIEAIEKSLETGEVVYL